MIRSSHTYNEDTTFQVAPLKFDGYDKKPSSFYVRFILDGIEYEYSFSLTQTEMLTEQLCYYPKGRRSLVFTRDETKGPNKTDIYEFRQAIKRPMDVAANTSRKILFVYEPARWIGISRKRCSISSLKILFWITKNQLCRQRIF